MTNHAPLRARFLELLGEGQSCSASSAYIAYLHGVVRIEIVDLDELAGRVVAFGHGGYM